MVNRDVLDLPLLAPIDELSDMLLLKAIHRDFVQNLPKDSNPACLVVAIPVIGIYVFLKV